MRITGGSGMPWPQTGLVLNLSRSSVHLTVTITLGTGARTALLPFTPGDREPLPTLLGNRADHRSVSCMSTCAWSSVTYCSARLWATARRDFARGQNILLERGRGTHRLFSILSYFCKAPKMHKTHQKQRKEEQGTWQSLTAL